MEDLILQDSKCVRPNISSIKNISWSASYSLDSCEDEPHVRSPELSARGLGNERKGVCQCLLTAVGGAAASFTIEGEKQQLAL